MKKVILLNSYVGDQLKTLVTSDYSWSAVTSTKHKATDHKSSATRATKKKSADK